MQISESLLKSPNNHHLLEKITERAFSNACSAVVFLAGVVMRQCLMQMFKCAAVWQYENARVFFHTLRTDLYALLLSLSRTRTQTHSSSFNLYYGHSTTTNQPEIHQILPRSKRCQSNKYIEIVNLTAALTYFKDQWFRIPIEPILNLLLFIFMVQWGWMEQCVTFTQSHWGIVVLWKLLSDTQLQPGTSVRRNLACQMLQNKY